ncbi:MAG: hypothetical protein HYU28_08170 [Actinobacteria bacterium]|nr:hypothetical protein [Actinomycetota bacterium]
MTLTHAARATTSQNEVAVVAKITDAALDSQGAPAPLIVDSRRNLGFAIGRVGGDNPVLTAYNLRTLTRDPNNTAATTLDSSDIFRFAVDEERGRLIGPEKSLALDTNPCSNDNPASQSKVRVHDYDDAGKLALEATLTIPCSGAFKFVPFSASIFRTPSGRQKLLAAGTYAHEGSHNSQPQTKNNLGQPLIVRQMDLGLLDSPDWRDALDWEIDLRYGGCGRWDESYRVLVEKLGSDVLSYCWDTEPLLRSLGAQGYVVRVPLHARSAADDTPIPLTLKGTPVLPDPTNPTPFLKPPQVPPNPNPLDWIGGGDPVGFPLKVIHFLCPLPVPIPNTPPNAVANLCNNSPKGEPTPDLSDLGFDSDQAIDETTNFAEDLADEVDPNEVVPPLSDPSNPTGSKFVANAVVKRIPTFPGDASPFVDRGSSRLLLLTADATNGNAVWVFDPREGAERFVGLFTGGDPEANPLKTAAGFDPVSGRGYVVTSKGLLVGSVRKTPIGGRVFPVVGDFEENGKLFEQTVPAQSVGVAPSLHRLFVPVLEQEVLPPLPTPQPAEMPRVERLVAMFGKLLGALRETPPNTNQALAAIQEFLDKDPLGKNVKECTKDGAVVAALRLTTCLNKIVESLSNESAVQTIDTCLTAMRGLLRTDGTLPTSDQISAAVGTCTAALGEYVGQPPPPPARPQAERAYYLVLEDRSPEPPIQASDDPDSRTLQIAEEDGKTDVDKTGASLAAGAHVVVTGGLPRAVNQLDPLCEAPNETWETRVPVKERDLLNRQCLADQIVSRGNREYFVAYADVDTGTSTGANAEASGVFVPLTERPTDEDVRNLGSCGAGAASRLANPATSQDPEFQDGFNDFLDGYGQVCDPLQAGLVQPVGDNLQDGTHGSDGSGFPVPSALCNDFGGRPASDVEPDSGAQNADALKSALVVADAHCDADRTTVAGSASASGALIPSLPLLTGTGASAANAGGGATPFFTTGRLWSAVRSTPTANGQLTTAISIAEGVRIGPLYVGSIRTTAATIAKGRTGTARVAITREWCGTAIEGVLTVAGCADPTTDPVIQDAINDANQLLGKVRVSVPEFSADATDGGYQSVVTKHPDVRAADQAVNEDDSLTVPGVQVVVYNDGAEGRNRVVIQLAGVQAESRYAVVALPNFAIPDFPELEFVADPVVRALAVARKGTPPRVEKIPAVPASFEQPADNPLKRLLQSPFATLKDLLGWLINNLGEAALLALLFSILFTPVYMFMRRRAFERTMAL